ncbi:hypothetical protein KS4_23970 [Poriferisphaera corsica]|uniref:Uncharacterized protein n=1 Tax=Poriferisphaera corsica TaxID=2528020 RepID=A0A517YVT5_9BACT|nr:hypothetical protein [Poriferisphaera corsica]QDU34329.1 hypothetical protein KS4_23970 [Poriferisphaera corsica]
MDENNSPKAGLYSIIEPLISLLGCLGAFVFLLVVLGFVGFLLSLMGLTFSDDEYDPHIMSPAEQRFNAIDDARDQGLYSEDE